ncbi:unnamed protein product [Soboliphyme baturini]|uniref:Sec7_N domain-containing protein n=1 Tax=Soboliphyme baturini TaxID=241478 RepID=A0A183J448_9BILA|nr:unnamed protein product [Soboliphyme baturini]
MSMNGVYIVQGELNSVVTILRRTLLTRDGVVSDEDPLLRSFADLREVLNYVVDLADMAPSTFVAPFLDVIRSEHTTGPATGRALIAINKFVTYGLLNFSNCKVNSAILQIAEAVTHARFVGTDPSNDEVVLLRILQVLRTIMLSPVGSLLTDETVCEILQSCFRICFESRLTCLLRKAAESCLIDMVQLLFTRLPTFVEDLHHPYIRRLKMQSTLKDGSHRRKSKKKPKDIAQPANSTEADSTSKGNEMSPTEGGDASVETAIKDSKPEAAATNTSVGEAEQQKVVDVHGDFGFVVEEHDRLMRSYSEATVSVSSISKDESERESHQELRDEGSGVVAQCSLEDKYEVVVVDQCPAVQLESDSQSNDVRFTIDDQMTSKPPLLPTKETLNENENSDETSEVSTLPYGLPCVRELLRFLITLCNPWEQQNSGSMIELALNLIIVALEAGADHLGKYSVLLPMVQNELCRNIISLLGTSQVTLLSLTLRAGFLIFEALRTYLKFQLEMYLLRLMALAVADMQALHNMSSSVQYHPISEVQ